MSKPADHTSGCTCQKCNTKLICPQCVEVNAVTIQPKYRICSLATSIAVTAVFLGLFLIPNMSTHICECVSPKDCYASGIEMKLTTERRTSVYLHMVNHKGEGCNGKIKNATCELIHNLTGKVSECEVVGSKYYEASYQPTSQGRHQLHIKVEGEHIKGSPYIVTVIKSFGPPTKTIKEVKGPRGVAVNQRGEIIVAEKRCISVFSPTGIKVQSFGQLPLRAENVYDDVAVDGDGNIVVMDNRLNIKKFSSDYKLIASINNNKQSFACGIGVSPITGKIAVAYYDSGSFQIFNPDLTLYKTVHTGGDSGMPVTSIISTDVAFDSAGNIYVTGFGNYCFQVFNPEGVFLYNGTTGIFENTSIYIDDYDTVFLTTNAFFYIFAYTREGKFLTYDIRAFNGTKGFPKHMGLAVDKNGTIYVADNFYNTIEII